MDRYHRVERPQEESPIDANEVRITAMGRMRNYISYAAVLLQEKGSNKIVFKAMGRAINKAVMIVELIKRRIVGLHQITSVGSINIIDTWEPLEEGLLPLETTRHVSVITIILSKEEPDTSSVGYQCPLPSDQVKQWTEFDYGREAGVPGGRGRGRVGTGRVKARGNGNAVDGDGDGDGGCDDPGHGYGRGVRNPGRGRALRGRSMDGRHGGHVDRQGGDHGMRGGGGHDMEGNDGRLDDQHHERGHNDGSFAPPRVKGRGCGRGQGHGSGRNFGANEPARGGA